MANMDLLAKISGIKYHPFLCRELEPFDFENLEKALSCTSFILNIDKDNKVAISWWVSAKRTRSYPYVRIYDTLGFLGKKITIIPVFKDEGRDGDRDFLQWDTVSLMSLLGIYVIIAYYNKADKSERYKNKITNQRFDIDYIRGQVKNIIAYQSDALHWNLAHLNDVGNVSVKALNAYDRISKKLGIEMHSRELAEKRIRELLKGKDDFIKLSRLLAEKAQRRESLTLQPKEKLVGTKAIITIQNYLGGYYYFTSDEVEFNSEEVFLIECKHSQNNCFPSLDDIKDGLVKMILFSNLEKINIDGKDFKPIAVLKLTAGDKFDEGKLSISQKDTLKVLHKESKLNNFEIRIL